MIRPIIAVLISLLAAGTTSGQVQRALNRGQNFSQGTMRQQSFGLVHEPFVEPITAEKIRTAIDDAVMCLRNQQAQDGSIEEGYAQGGGTALAALTMLAAGANPASDDQLKMALDWLASVEPNNTYVRGIRANVWEYALRKVPYDDNIRAHLKADYEWLLAALGDREGWRYTMQSRDWDNSCTQYGVLGIWAAARAGFEPGDQFWITMSKHFRACQNSDGGWGYTGGSGSSANMATAGLASMFLVFDMYHGRSYYQTDDPRTFATGEAADVLESIRRGMDWLGQVQHGKEDGYYLYGIERTGVASGRRYIGSEDWFARGALTVLQAQQSDGSIPLGSWGRSVIGTSFCTLFLVYGGAPVAFNKLQYGDGHDWNLNPRDLANLSKQLWSAYERPLNWQTVSIDSADKFEAPILFISGAEAMKFSEEQMLRLRRYVLRGGTILAEPSDYSPQFTRSMENLLGQMFRPDDYPECRLEPLPAEHGIYTVVKQDWKSRPRLRGAGDGSRTFFILSDEYTSADWQTNRTDSDASKLAMNLLFYATDLGTLKGKFTSTLPNTPAAKPREATTTVARLKHASDAEHPRDWDAAAAGWTEFAPYAKHVTGCDLKEIQPVVLGQSALDDVRLLHVTGRRELKLSSNEREALKGFIASGGTVLVDSYAGSPRFAAAAKAELEAVFGELQPLANDQILSEGRFEGGVGLSNARFKLPARQLLRRRDEETSGQKLQVAFAGNRPAVVFSEFDLSAAMAGVENYRSLGYKPDSARKIVGNLVALLMLD